jgi:hypothetical protein
MCYIMFRFPEKKKNLFGKYPQYEMARVSGPVNIDKKKKKCN